MKPNAPPPTTAYSCSCRTATNAPATPTLQVDPIFVDIIGDVCIKPVPAEDCAAGGAGLRGVQDTLDSRLYDFTTAITVNYE